MVDSAGPSGSLPVSSHQDVLSPAEQPAVVSMASFQSMISSMVQDALYSHLAHLGLPAIPGSSSQANNPTTLSNSMQFSSSALMSDWQRPGMSNLFGSVTPAPSFVGTNTQFSVVNSTALCSVPASVMNAVSNVATVTSTDSQSCLSLPHFKALEVAPSVPPVPAELVDLISQNSYVHFKFLLPSNLAVIAFLAAISQQNISRIPPSRLKSISSFRDWSAAWAVFASVVSQLSPDNYLDLLAYFILISGAAERGDFDWLSYDSKFRQNVVSHDKRWGVPDLSIWL